MSLLRYRYSTPVHDLSLDTLANLQRQIVKPFTEEKLNSESANRYFATGEE